MGHCELINVIKNMQTSLPKQISTRRNQRVLLPFQREDGVDRFIGLDYIAMDLDPEDRDQVLDFIRCSVSFGNCGSVNSGQPFDGVGLA